MADYRCDHQGNGSSGQTILALKLSPGAQKDALHNRQAVIIAILNKAVPGSGNGARVVPLIVEPPPEVLDRLVERAIRIDPTYTPTDFRAWYRVLLAIPAESRQLAELLRLLNSSDFPDVESASVVRAHPLRQDPVPESTPPPAIVSTAPQLVTARGDTPNSNAPVGIGSSSLRGQNGGWGNGIRFVDLEHAWDLTHPDLTRQPMGSPASASSLSVQIVPGAFDSTIENDAGDVDHGTEVLGVVLRQSTGVAPQCDAHVVSDLGQDGFTVATGIPNVAAAIIEALLVIQYGDVLLTEIQEYRPGGGDYGFPAESDPSTFDAIRLATALGVVVVEAAGNTNNGTDLDSIDVFNTKDSGAIIVAAAVKKGTAAAAPPLAPQSKKLLKKVSGLPAKSNFVRRGDSNFGSRINLFAWGDDIPTCTSDGTVQSSTSSFGGTSGAAAIVAGAAVLVQAIAGQRKSMPPGFRFPPRELRKLLTYNGTLSVNGPNDKIGVMPNLSAVISSPFLNAQPDIYIRDFDGDDGVRPLLNGPTSQSPDIIVQPADAGQGYSVYVQVKNRGTPITTSIPVNVYFAQASTFLSPTSVKWMSLGSTSVALTDNTLTKSTSGLPWKPPTAGPFCLIAVLGAIPGPDGTSLDTTPGPGDFGEAGEYREYAAGSNKIAARNIIVVSAPAGSSQTSQFSVLGYGIKSTLETMPSLPQDFQVSLLMPPGLAGQLQYQFANEAQAQPDANGMVNIPIPPVVNTTIGTGGVLAANTLFPCQLVVAVPSQAQNGTYGFAIRQLEADSGEEVGRVTWQFVVAAQLTTPIT